MCSLLCCFKLVVAAVTLRKYVYDACVCMFCFMPVWGLVLWTALRKGLYYNYEKSFDMLLLMTEFDCSEVTLCG